MTIHDHINALPEWGNIYTDGDSTMSVDKLPFTITDLKALANEHAAMKAAIEGLVFCSCRNKLDDGRINTHLEHLEKAINK